MCFLKIKPNEKGKEYEQQRNQRKDCQTEKGEKCSNTGTLLCGWGSTGTVSYTHLDVYKRQVEKPGSVPK